MNSHPVLIASGLLATLTLGTLGAFALASAPEAALATPAVEGTEYVIDTTHSAALFKVKHMGTSWFYGRFNVISGDVVYDAEDPGESRVLIKIATQSVDTKTDGLDKHLKSPDFFDAAQFPEIIFESQSVSKGKEKGSLEVTGNLTIHGVTKEVTTEIEVVGQGEGRSGEKLAGFHTAFTIDRTEYGMKYGAGGGGVGEEVKIIISLECSEKK